MLNTSHGPGIYALRVGVPSGVESIQRRWLDEIGAPLPDSYAEQLAECETALYVGRSANVYDRIMDHCEAKIRRASFIRAFEIKDIYGVWAADANTGVAERDRARALSDANTVVWTDGELF